MSQLMISSGFSCEIDIFSSFFHSLKSFLEFLEASTTHWPWPRMLATVSAGSRKPGPLSHEDQVHQLLSHRDTYGKGYRSTQICHNFRIWSPEKGFLLSMHRSLRTNISCKCVCQTFRTICPDGFCGHSEITATFQGQRLEA